LRISVVARVQLEKEECGGKPNFIPHAPFTERAELIISRYVTNKEIVLSVRDLSRSKDKHNT
jgi:hypothetical protein